MFRITRLPTDLMALLYDGLHQGLWRTC